MGSKADWNSLEGIITSLLDGNPIAILVTAFVAFGFPVLLHLIFYRTVASPPVSTFLLLGPSGAGKTALVTLVSTWFMCSPGTKKHIVPETLLTSEIA